jgi:hypothetical protein
MRIVRSLGFRVITGIDTWLSATVCAERARAKHELVHRLRAEGRGLREIARHLG